MFLGGSDGAELSGPRQLEKEEFSSFCLDSEATL